VSVLSSIYSRAAADTSEQASERLGASPRSRTGVGNGTVVFYLLLAVLAMLPGVALKLGWDGLLSGRWRDFLGVLRAALDDIRFGSGLRFWLGVTGATMMGLLLLYPLRKLFAKGRRLGPVGRWFHLHILFGLFGPILILYHANFGLGGSNANVALWTMLVVAASGFAGFFVYGRVSRNFYTARQQAEQHRDAILAIYPDIEKVRASRNKLAEAFDHCQTDLLTPRQGVLASLKARLRVEGYRRDLVHDTVWLLDECARQLDLPVQQHEQYRAAAGKHLRAYFQLARAGASASVREQLWARWRLFHLPVFLVMVAATTLHILAVWDMDDDGYGIGKPVLKTAVQPAARVAQRPASQPARPTTPFRQATDVRSSQDRQAAAHEQRSEASSSGDTVPVVAVRPVTIGGGTGEVGKPPGMKTGPAPSSSPVTARKNDNSPEKKVANIESAAVPAPKTTALPERAQGATIAADRSRPAVSPAPEPRNDPLQPTDMTSVYTELERKTETAPMGLGAGRPRTLSEQIATFKARQTAGTFAHSLVETGFALTGKHLKAECADCHTAPLAESKRATVRQCIACHKSDDVHRGRRPDCAQCHTTNRWGDRIRRK
jgi:hypothetical protein